MRRTVCFLLSALLLLSLCACGVKISSRPSPAPAAEPETPASPDGDSPDFSFSTTDREGNVWDESVFQTHKLTMLNFWEPWCGPCVQEMPDLRKLSEEYADRGLQILGVYSSPGMEEDVDTVLESTGVQYPILHYTEAFDIFRSGYVPTTVFVDEGGHVLGEQLYVGSRSYADWETLILELLG